jgi:hypothetical protein
MRDYNNSQVSYKKKMITINFIKKQFSNDIKQ